MFSSWNTSPYNSSVSYSISSYSLFSWFCFQYWYMPIEFPSSFSHLLCLSISYDCLSSTWFYKGILLYICTKINLLVIYIVSASSHVLDLLKLFYYSVFKQRGSRETDLENSKSTFLCYYIKICLQGRRELNWMSWLICPELCISITLQSIASHFSNEMPYYQ